jgi:hypothetical protein
MKSDKENRATLVIASESISAEEIQSILAIAGDELVEKGTRLSNRLGSKVFEHSAWKLKSKLEEERPIDQHIQTLLDQMETKQRELSKLAESCSIELWCFVAFENSQCGFVFQRQLLKRIAALPCDLVFDIYG